MSPITVYIAHKVESIRKMLRELLLREEGFLTLGLSARGSDTLAKVGKMKPNVLLLDAGLTPKNREDLIGSIRRISPATKIISLPAKYVRTDELRLARAGARGYLPKAMVPSFLPKAVRVVHDGEIWMRKETVSLIFEEYVRAASIKRLAATAGVTTLTEREVKILRGIVQDKSRRDIARSLGTNEKSVERSLNAIIQKLR